MGLSAQSGALQFSYGALPMLNIGLTAIQGSKKGDAALSIRVPTDFIVGDRFPCGNVCVGNSTAVADHDQKNTTRGIFGLCSLSVRFDPRGDVFNAEKALRGVQSQADQFRLRIMERDAVFAQD